MKQSQDKKPELIEFGKRIRDLRNNKKKMSQGNAAKELDLKQTVLSSYENGDREPPFITLNKIARYYGVTIDYLTGNSEYFSPQYEPSFNNISGKTRIQNSNAIRNIQTSIDEIINCFSKYSKNVVLPTRHKDKQNEVFEGNSTFKSIIFFLGTICDYLTLLMDYYDDCKEGLFTKKYESYLETMDLLKRDIFSNMLIIEKAVNAATQTLISNDYIPVEYKADIYLFATAQLANIPYEREKWNSKKESE